MKALSLVAAALGLGQLPMPLQAEIEAHPHVRRARRDVAVGPVGCTACHDMGDAKGCRSCHRTRPRKLFRRIMHGRAF